VFTDRMIYEMDRISGSLLTVATTSLAMPMKGCGSGMSDWTISHARYYSGKARKPGIHIFCGLYYGMPCGNGIRAIFFDFTLLFKWLTCRL